MSKKIVTNKQKTIQTLIYTFRFINSKQIQKFLEHKDHRRINKWLKDLTEKEYLEKDFKPVFGTLTKPAVYNLASRGRTFIRKTYPQAFPKYLERLRDDKDRSKAYRIKCQIIADFYLIIFESYIPEFVKELEEILTHGVKLKFNQFHFFTPAFYQDLEFVLLPKLKPDAYVYKRTEEGATHTCIYVLDAYIPRMMLRYSILNIFTVLNDEYWEDETIDTLQFYFVCPNNVIIVYLRRLLPSFLEKYYGGKEIIFHFATRNQLYKRLKTKSGKTGWTDISSKDF